MVDGVDVISHVMTVVSGTDKAKLIDFETLQTMIGWRSISSLSLKAVKTADQMWLCLLMVYPLL